MKKREWVAECRHVSYKGGPWPRNEFLQWEVNGIDVPPGRGYFYQDDAYLVAAAPALLGALESTLDWLDDGNRILSDACAADVKAARAAVAAAKGEA